jgi:hypothetical protein
VIFGNKDVVLVVFEIFLLHKDRVFLPSNYKNGISRKLYLYEEEKSQKQRGQHLYYRRSHKVSTIHHQRTKYTEKSKKKLIPI